MRTLNFKKLGKSELNQINVQFGEEEIKFNLFEELQIDEDSMDDELKSQPSYYGFLTLLHKRLLTKFEDLKLDRKRITAELYLEAKDLIHNGRPYNDDMCKAYVEKSKKYLRATRSCIKAKNDADVVYACVKGFDQRASLMQTLSSNNRKFN